ncbi:MAG: phage portal protein, partial [Clostridium celatum]|nr:phage portal protein [Clostridium celatum]
MDIFTNNMFFGIFISLIAFEIGLFVYKKTKLPLFNPLLIASIIIIAFLKIFNITLEDEVDKEGNPVLDANGNVKKKEPVIRNNQIMYFNGEGDSKPDAEWLIKNINDAFIKNTRNDIKDLMYVLTNHIDTNEKLQSNLSGVALRSRLQGLESKCTYNAKAFENLLRTRLECMFKYLAMTQGKKYDVNLIEVKFTPNVPIDEDRIADRISKIPHDVVSNETK